MGVTNLQEIQYHASIINCKIQCEQLLFSCRNHRKYKGHVAKIAKSFRFYLDACPADFTLDLNLGISNSMVKSM